MKTKGFNQKVSIKSIEGATEGSFEAYGNVFGVKDNAGDISVKGCFSETISQHKNEGTMPRLLAQHGHSQMPIGIISDMVEDEKGLRFKGQFCLDTQAGAEAHALCKMGAIDQFSIGYVTVDSEMTMKGNLLKELDVKEISLVTFACNEESTLIDVKSAIEKNELSSNLLQKAVREAFGLSVKQTDAAINAIMDTERIENSDGKDADVELEHKETEVTVETKELSPLESFKLKQADESTGAIEIKQAVGGLEVKNLGTLSIQEVLCCLKSDLVKYIMHDCFWLEAVYAENGYVEYWCYVTEMHKMAEFTWSMSEDGKPLIDSFTKGLGGYGMVFIPETVSTMEETTEVNEIAEEVVEVKETIDELELLAKDFLAEIEVKEQPVEVETKSDDFDLDTLDLSLLK